MARVAHRREGRRPDKSECEGCEGVEVGRRGRGMDVACGNIVASLGGTLYSLLPTPFALRPARHSAHARPCLTA